jgi:hypothetical protein
MKKYKVIITSTLEVIAANETKAEEIAESKLNTIPKTFNPKLFSVGLVEDLAHRGNNGG